MERENRARLDKENWFCSGGGIGQCQAGLNNNNDTCCLVPWIPPTTSTTDTSSSLSQFHGCGGSSSGCGSLPFWPAEMNWEGVEEEDKAVAASKNHSQAEKRRRDRINAHLAALRKLISKSDKMDKAAVLGSVVEHVKDLKRKTTEISKIFTVPTDTDEVIIDSDSDHIKASVCCDDRPELFSELKHALKGLRLTTVRADMTSLGGRIKGIFLLCTEDSSTKLDGIGMNNLKQSLRAVLSRIASSSTTESNYRIKSKRQRFFFPSHHHQSQ